MMSIYKISPGNKRKVLIEAISTLIQGIKCNIFGGNPFDIRQKMLVLISSQFSRAMTNVCQGTQIIFFFPGGGGLPIPGIIRKWHLTGMVQRKIALHKGPHLKFCLTKGSLFGPKIALQNGPFLLNLKVSPLKMHVCHRQT